MAGGGHAWGACMVGGMCGSGACMVSRHVAGETATTADGMHPTRVHSCVQY